MEGYTVLGLLHRIAGSDAAVAALLRASLRQGDVGLINTLRTAGMIRLVGVNMWALTPGATYEQAHAVLWLAVQQ